MKTSSNALTRVRKHFPQVNKVVDARKSIQVAVTRKDSKAGRKKDVNNCALAKACVRSKIADGAIIGIGFSYLVNGEVATRYKTSTSVAREIVSFDRHHDFAAGRDYTLSKVGPTARLGNHNKPDAKKHGPRLTKKPDPDRIVHHRTSRIRVMSK